MRTEQVPDEIGRHASANPRSKDNIFLLCWNPELMRINSLTAMSLGAHGTFLVQFSCTCLRAVSMELNCCQLGVSLAIDKLNVSVDGDSLPFLSTALLHVTRIELW